MLNLDFSWVLLFLPLPLLARWFLVAAQHPEQALSVPLLNGHGGHEQFGSALAAPSIRLAKVCLWLFWAALLCAASRPHWLEEPVSRNASGRDLMLAVDISGSMSEPDMTIDSIVASRIDVIKIVLGNFIERREGDRLGLILFGTNAYSFVPLTFDLSTLKKLLLDISTGLAGRHTAIGDAIGIAIKSMSEQKAKHKVLILITDGSNTMGFQNPVLAARAAHERGLTIYTIGVGSDNDALSRIYGQQNIPPGIALNETLLNQIATLTGGQYFRATNTFRLEEIYRSLDELEPVVYEYQSHRPRSELFMWPLLTGISIMLCFIAWRIGTSRAGPTHDLI